ncbi:MAG TPA: RsmE family RNA methyltransferase, partial [bacterium]|nr:RsmE family RNA methyltransferase [bacterium]
MPVFPLAQTPQPDGRFEISAEQRHHLLRVLRLKAGATFEVSLPDGRRGQARLVASGDSLHGLWIEDSALSSTPSLAAWLAIGLIRMSRLEWLVEKATELGADRLSLLRLSQGSLPKSESISINKINRLKKISQETLKQCERSTFMRIDEPESLEEFLDRLDIEAPSSSRILLRERAKLPLLSQVLEKKAGMTILLVGPEGGFSDRECRAAEKFGFEPASLGPALLRSETAALAALSHLHLRQSAGG